MTRSSRDECPGSSSGTGPGPASSLTYFQSHRLLAIDPLTKQAAVAGTISPDTDLQALIVIEPIPFHANELQEFIQSCDLDLNLHNDAYSSYTARARGKYQLQLTYPATNKHIDKYVQQRYYRIAETKHIYQSHILPYINSIPVERTQWVRNIIEGRCEQDRILYNDIDAQHGFILLPDIKWDTSNIENLYVQAIARDANIRSLRDLGREHLPLLINILKKGISCVAERYSIDPALLRAFVHYQPSFYHFHVHIVHSALTTSSCVIGRAILLEDIIDNIQLLDTYYQERVLYYYLPESHDIYKLISTSITSNDI